MAGLMTSWLAAGCITIVQAPGQGGGNSSSSAGADSANGATAAATSDLPAPPPPPAAPVPSVQASDIHIARFLELWKSMHDLSNGYFSKEGIPYHAVETLIAEAPDHGHETTSEAFSYWLWLEAMYGKVTKDFSHLDRAWSTMEYFIIPQKSDQPTNGGYNPGRAATFAPEMDHAEEYPVPLDPGVQVGQDPLGDELRQTYGTPDIYAMHWLVDVDNWYGFGRRGDGSSRAAYINTFQRGPEESVYETIPQPCWDEFKWGGPNGFLDIFQKSGNFAKQWKYTNAPDADARAVQAIYWAKVWADENGGSDVVDKLTKKASRMGDYVRYALFDKYFKSMGCTSPKCAVGKDREAAHYLLSWYFAWGGARPGNGNWAWRIGSSHNHSGYQNPMAAYALSQFPPLKPASPTGAKDWQESAKRQIEFYRWLQAAEGGIAGGATNSWKGRYEKPPNGTKTFYGMFYEEAPVFRDPPSNEWFGFQVWTMERVAEYYYVSGDPKAKLILDRWVPWARANTKLGKDGSFAVPSTLQWSGQPANDWNANAQNFEPSDKAYNSTLHVKVLSAYGDIGVAAGLAHTLTFYAKKSGDKASQDLARELVDRMWTKFHTDKGVVAEETRKDYKRFGDKVFLPSGFKGKMPNGDEINEHATFLSLRSKFKQDPDWGKVQAFLDGGAPPKFTYHRFWVQSEVALALATYGWLFPEK